MEAEKKQEFRDKFGDLYHQLNMEQWIDDLVIEACKKQREICARFFDSFPDSTEWRDTKSLRDAILNAPKPEGII